MHSPSIPSLSVLDRLRLLPAMVRMAAWQFREKRGADVRCHDGAEAVTPPAAAAPRWRRLVRRGRNLLAFLQRMGQWNSSTLGQICGRLREARASGSVEVVLYGEGHVAETVRRCASICGVRVIGVCPWGLPDSRIPASLPRYPEADLAGTQATVVVATLVNSNRHLDRLTILNVPRARVIVLE